jgi:hypothetical protein
MSRTLNRTTAETAELLQNFAKKYPQITKYQAQVKSDCRLQGGRKLSFLFNETQQLPQKYEQNSVDDVSYQRSHHQTFQFHLKQNGRLSTQ